jgi:hypothetical protein
MTSLSRIIAAFLLTSSAVVACGGAQTPPSPPPIGGPTDESSAPTTPSDGERAARPTIAAQACEANGGTVVGDIGDGAIHRPEYRCANGAKPTANIAQEEGGPVSIEGSVCCPK